MAHKKENYSVPKMLGIGGTYIYLTAMLAIYPAFYRENLLNLITDKKSFFCFFSIIYFICLCPGVVEYLFEIIKEHKKIKIRPDTIFLGILLLAVGVSTIFSIDRSASLTGLGYRTVAADMFVICILSYLGVRAYGKYNSCIIWSWVIGSTLIYLFGILCGCGINFMHMQDELAVPEIFLTPLGNTNFNASYVCLVLPLVLVMYMICRERFSKVIYFLVMYMGFLFSIFIKTESSMITVLACLFLLFFFVLEKEQWFLRYVEIWGIYILANTTVSVIWNIWKDKIYPFDGIGAFLLKGPVVLAEWLIYAGIILLWRWKKDKLRTGLLGLRKHMIVFFLALSLMGMFGIFIINTAFREQTKDGALQMLLLTDSSFSKRGILWRNTITLLKESSPLQILFGHGLNCYGKSIKPICYDEIIEWFGFLIKDPHNEFLQALTDMGILGTVGYFGLLITTLVFALRNWKKNELAIVVVLSVGSYLLQGIVNCYALTHLPILFILLGLANGDLKQ